MFARFEKLAGDFRVRIGRRRNDGRVDVGNELAIVGKGRNRKKIFRVVA